MSEEGIGSVGHYLKPGLAVSVQEESGEALAATIENSLSKEHRVEALQAHPRAVLPKWRPSLDEILG